jgi:uncharacterized membrane protein YfcA
MGVFGVGGSSVATPVLSLLGVPPLVAVASPLMATIPSATIAAVPYERSGDARPKAAAWSLLGAVPATIVGALLSRLVGGPTLLIASGVVLVVVGVQVSIGLLLSRSPWACCQPASLARTCPSTSPAVCSGARSASS